MWVIRTSVTLPNSYNGNHFLFFSTSRDAFFMSALSRHKFGAPPSAETFARHFPLRWRLPRFKTGWFDFRGGVALMNRPAPSLPVQSVTCTLLTSHFQLDLARLEPHFKIVPGTTTQWKRLTQWKAPIRDCSGLPTGQASISMNTYGISLDWQTELSHREQNNPKQYSRCQESSPNCFSIGGESGTSSSGPHTVHTCAVCGILQMQDPYKWDVVGKGRERAVWWHQIPSSFSSSVMSLYYWKKTHFYCCFGTSTIKTNFKNWDVAWHFVKEGHYNIQWVEFSVT